MAKRPQREPFNVYVVCRILRETPNATGIACLRAVCIKMAGSWWYVQHADGSITKHTGGQTHHPGSNIIEGAISRYRETIGEAYADALNECLYRLQHRGKEQPFTEAMKWRELAMCVAEQWAIDMNELGIVRGKIERDQELNATKPVHSVDGKVACSNTGICSRMIEREEATWFENRPYCGKCD